MENENVITREEGYDLTSQYVSYFWNTGKFYSLKNQYEVEDLVMEIYAKFLEKGFFEKYSKKVTSKKYFVMTAVKNSLIDMLRKYREVVSLDKEDESGLTLADKIESIENLEDTVEGKVHRDSLFSYLPKETDSKLVGKSPVLGTVNFSLWVIAYHLELGYSVKDISGMFFNKNSGKYVTAGHVYQAVYKIREILKSQLEMI